MVLRDIRKSKGITQQTAADFVGIPLRTYSNYENDPQKKGSIKYQYIVEKLCSYGFVDEEHGILTVSDIKKICETVLSKYDVSFCYLFGSYAKGKATPVSDVDLLISTNVRGLKFYGLVEEIRTELHKKVDVLDMSQLKENIDLTEEIFKDGIKIYG